MCPGRDAGSGMRVAARLRHFSVVVLRRLWSAQYERKHLIDARHEVYAQVALDLAGHVFQIAFVAGWQHYFPDTGPVRGQHLILDAADWQDVAAQRDLPGHRHIRTYRR